MTSGQARKLTRLPASEEGRFQDYARDEKKKTGKVVWKPTRKRKKTKAVNLAKGM